MKIINYCIDQLNEKVIIIMHDDLTKASAIVRNLKPSMISCQVTSLYIPYTDLFFYLLLHYNPAVCEFVKW